MLTFLPRLRVSPHHVIPLELFVFVIQFFNRNLQALCDNTMTKRSGAGRRHPFEGFRGIEDARVLNDGLQMLWNEFQGLRASNIFDENAIRRGSFFILFYFIFFPLQLQSSAQSLTSCRTRLHFHLRAFLVFPADSAVGTFWNFNG